MRRAIATALAASAIVAVAPEASGATRYVAATGSDANNTCLTNPCATVHHAVEVAAAGDVISIGPGEFIEGDQIVLSKALTVKGAGPLNTAVIAINTHRVFKIESSVLVEINGLAIRGGEAIDIPPCIDCGYGGGLLNRGALTLKNVHIRNNHAIQGGGIYNDIGATLSLVDTLVHDNIADYAGGGIRNLGDVTLTDVYVLGNATTQIGAGIATAVGTLEGSRVLFESNVITLPQGVGGGLVNTDDGIVRLRNSTFSANNGGYWAGAIGTSAYVELTHVTIADNVAFGGGQSGGVVVFEPAGYASLRNTIIGNNTGLQCFRSLRESQLLGKPTPLTVEFGGAGNMISDTSCNLWPSYNLVADPVLGPLAYNGGKTPTYPLLPASPAIDAASKWFCVSEDQRGFTRPIDGNGNGQATCDIGAFEYGSTAPATGKQKKVTQKGPLFPAGIGGATAPRR